MRVCRRGCCRRSGLDDGSTASTATRCPAAARSVPSASMKVDLPAPGTPVMPSRGPRPLSGAAASSSCLRRLGGLARLDERDRAAQHGCGCPRDARGVGRRTSPWDPPPLLSAVAGARPATTKRSAAAVGDYRPGREDGLGARRVQGVEVLRRDDAADDDQMSPAGRPRRAARSSGHERQVAGGERRHADHVDVGLDGLPRDLGRASGRAARRRRRSRGRRTRWRPPSGPGRGRPGPSSRRGCADAARPLGELVG